MNKSVLILSLCQALLVSGNILLVAVNALIGQRLAPSPELITLPVAFQFIGLMLTTIPASMIMAKTGRKRGFILGNLIGIIGALVCILALAMANFSLFCLGTLLLGVGIGFGNLYRFAALEVCADDYKSQALSLTMAGGVLAALIGPNLAIYSQRLMPEPPFLGAFIALTLLYILALVLLSRIQIPDTYVHNPDKPGRPLTAIARQPLFIMAVVAAVVGYAVMGLVMTATPLAMHRHGFHFDDAAWVIEWHVLGMFVPSFFTGKLIQRFGLINTMSAGALLILACLSINLMGQSHDHFFIALILLGVGWNFMFISATQMVTEAYRPEEKAKSQALNEFLVFSAVTLSALASGWMEATLGWVLLNLSMIPIVLLGLGTIGWYQWTRKRRQPADSRLP